jgi:hypothetical protein
MSLYDLPKDILIKLLATSQEENEAKIKDLTDKLEVKTKQCDKLQEISRYSIYTCSKCDIYVILQYGRPDMEFCEECQQYTCFNCGFHCNYKYNEGGKCYSYNCFDCNDASYCENCNEEYCIEHIELHKDCCKK